MHLNKDLKYKIRKIVEYNSMKNPYFWTKGRKDNIFKELPISLRYKIAMNV